MTKINWKILEIKSNFVESSSKNNKRKSENLGRICDQSKYDYSKKLVKEKRNFKKLSSINRLVVFNNKKVGTDISLLVTSGIKGNEKL